MKSRWIIAAAAALALSLLTLPLLRRGGHERLPSARVAADAENGPTCDAESNAKGKLDFVLKDMNNATVKMADYKGKVVLINFWATWCGPCKIEIPAFVELYDRYKDQGLVIAGVSIDDGPDVLRAFAKEWRMQYPLLLIQTDVEDSYGPFYGIPTSFLLARDGTICRKHIGPATKEQLEQEIKALL